MRFLVLLGPLALFGCFESHGAAILPPPPPPDVDAGRAIVCDDDRYYGDALASDLMWKEIRELGKVKPIVASMSDVAASGGCEYMRPPRREGRRTD